MFDFLTLAYPLHSLSAIVWVGGMFFAHMALRPSVVVLDGPERLKLWAQVFPRFFFWVWIAIAFLLATGYGIIFIDYGDMANTPLHIHIMQGTGLLMMALYCFLYFGPFQRFKEQIAQENWQQAAKHQATIRRIVMTNLTLGIITAFIGSSRPFWS